MTLPPPLPGLRAVASRYDAFLVDQFGVLHDGRAPYPGAKDALRRLKDAGRRIAILSNSGKRAGPNVARMAEIGFGPELYDAFVSSGEVAWHALSATTFRSAFLISRDGDRSPVEGLALAEAARPEEAEVVLIAGSEGDRRELADYERLLASAARAGVPAFCLNPDQVMITARGLRFGAGRIARLYAALGGPVRFIGKPEPAIYAHALAALGGPVPDRVAGIGDSVEHDVVGALRAGCAAGLVCGGIHAGLDAQALARECVRHDALPTFALARFAW